MEHEFRRCIRIAFSGGDRHPIRDENPGRAEKWRRKVIVSLRLKEAAEKFASVALYALRPVVVMVLLVMLAHGPGISGLMERGWLVLVGFGGALVANATGIGGGVVFVPAFDALSLPPEKIVGTSLAIQCFGMSMGALTFLARGRIGVLPQLERGGVARISAPEILAITLLCALLGFVCATVGGFRPNAPLAVIFKALSLTLLVVLLLTRKVRLMDHHPLSRGRDVGALALIGVVGGAFIAWISIGVGELLAVYLMLRGVRAVEAVGLAVIATALCVLAARGLLPDALAVERDIALLVAPGALLGGLVAPALLDRLGEARVKWFCCFWILVSALSM